MEAENSFLQLFTLMDKMRARQDVMERLVEVALMSMPDVKALDVVQRTHDRYSKSREEHPGERHPDSDASAIELLMRWRQVAGG